MAVVPNVKKNRTKRARRGEGISKSSVAFQEQLQCEFPEIAGKGDVPAIQGL
jgi:hypothetical protein